MDVLRRFFQIVFPLVELLLGGLGIRQNLKRWRRGFALRDDARDGFFHRLFEILRGRLRCSLLGRVGSRVAYGLLDGVADLFVELAGVCLSGPASFIDDLRRLLGGLLHDLAHAGLGDALHRNLDGSLDGIVKLRVQLLADDRHLFIDRRLSVPAKRFVEVVFDVGGQLRHLAREIRLRFSRRCRLVDDVNLALCVRARCCWRNRRRARH